MIQKVILLELIVDAGLLERCGSILATFVQLSHNNILMDSINFQLYTISMLATYS